MSAPVIGAPFFPQPAQAQLSSFFEVPHSPSPSQKPVRPGVSHGAMSSSGGQSGESYINLKCFCCWLIFSRVSRSREAVPSRGVDV